MDSTVTTSSQFSFLLSDHLDKTRRDFYRADLATSELASYTAWGVASGNFGTTTAYTYTGQYSYAATFGFENQNAAILSVDLGGGAYFWIFTFYQDRNFNLSYWEAAD